MGGLHELIFKNTKTGLNRPSLKNYILNKKSWVTEKENMALNSHFECHQLRICFSVTMSVSVGAKTRVGYRLVNICFLKLKVFLKIL